MKIVISLPYEANEAKLKPFIEGVSHLKRLGHNVIDSSDSTGKKTMSKEALAKIVTKVDKSIKETDILIAEVSYPDSKVGYEIARALDEKKVVIMLEDEKSNSTFSPFIQANGSRTLIYKKYNSKSVIDIVDKALKEAAGKLDSKFILIISPEIDRYLEWGSQTKRMHKAQIVREALEMMMKKDKEYKTYLQG